MKNDIPTALEFFIKQKTYTSIEQFMIEFAKLHVKAALEEALSESETYMDGSCVFNEFEKSILNAYSLTNIK